LIDPAETEGCYHLMTTDNFLLSVYAKYHRPEFIDPDPLSRVLRYPRIADREIAGLLCSSLALGRVNGILAACDRVLTVFGEDLRDNLARTSEHDLFSLLRGFRYRFFGEEHLAALLFGIRGAIKEYGSLENCMAAGYEDSHEDLLPALISFSKKLREHENSIPGILLSDPAKGGAAKRLHLYLRWMVRRDAIDPGGWKRFPASKLLAPVDTHVLRQAKKWGMTRRKSADLKTVREITAAFRRLDPRDPIRFDFSLSRLGINPRV
jgi:uncharacterized protein (TIGR02757 family)